MHVFGLTGGIGCGKSTVARSLGRRGVPILDADQVARDVVAPGTDGLSAIVHAFGTGILAVDGTLDRKKLGAIVFDNADRRRELNAIIHPCIAGESASRLGALAAQGYGLAIYDAALLVENNVHKSLEGLVVVTATERIQRARLMARDGLDEPEATARIRSQLPVAQKVSVATYVIDNSGTIERLERRVADLYAELVLTYGAPGRIAARS